MPTLKTSHYDVVVVGAGINGCCCAYFFNKAGLRVALVDQEGIASGGSGAAGAFISPKISKEGPLKSVMEKAHAKALDFYTALFPESTLRKPLLHIAKTDQDAAKLQSFKYSTRLQTDIPPEELLHTLTTPIENDTSVYFTDAAVVNAQQVCHALAKGIDFYRLKLTEPARDEGSWRIGEITASEIVLAIGAYPKVIPAPYLTLRGIWGHRIDIRTSAHLSSIVHHHVSISPTSNEGVMAIGATHDVHFSPFSHEPYDYRQGRAELLEKASRTLDLQNPEILKDYVGLRSGSNDYMPILGPMVDAEATLSLYPHLRHGEKVDPKDYVYYPNLTMINGSGGYGFVLAPYLAEKLTDYLVGKKEIDSELLPERFFTRWAKRAQS